MLTKTASRFAVASLLLATLAAPTSAAPSVGTGPEERAPQMTNAEFQRIQIGMTQRRVRRIVGSAGRVDADFAWCVIRSYSSRSSHPASRYQVKLKPRTLALACSE